MVMIECNNPDPFAPGPVGRDQDDDPRQRILRRQLYAGLRQTALGKLFTHVCLCHQAVKCASLPVEKR